ncbi:uncharacterized protein LOC125532778 [Triticum urartu]|uniref:uncharacterized protein LOC125532778 n=1 Tax=Triticum urartu TaxID=4572 RepID=UPI0020442231|nr:uncharacterized protein LOC125532778 [Triticum urartu]
MDAPPSLTRPPPPPRCTTMSRGTNVISYAVHNTNSTPGSLTTMGSRSSSTSVPPPSVVRSATDDASPASTRPPRAPQPETAVEPLIDYFTFEGPFLSTEQPGARGSRGCFYVEFGFEE